ncbi:hypothetical protein QYE76_011927 [Lolium multiflorum]|uniref:Pentatricopeptide repeat-containing protein n=1 Tax=Lolium multiflorum TaxID=4521 RepID=A0AAD8TW96_LOLMU|nr:hypothetical protein QYE76_011927 [Lolium multiflorum]
MFREMTSRGLVPGIVTCTSFMASLCKHGRSKEAAEIFNSMISKGHKPDIVSYLILLHGYANERCLVDMINLFNSMKDNGIVPNCKVLNILIGAYAKRGMMDEAMLMFTEMHGQGLSPDGCCIHGDLVKAKELVSEMMNKGIPRPSMSFFTLVISNLCKEGRVGHAKDIFDLVIHIGETPNVITFTSLIDGYCLVGKMDKALRVLDGMESAGVEPNVVTYNTLVNGCFKNGRVKDGLALFAEMKSIILGGLCRNNCVGEAIELFQELVEEADIIFSSMEKIGCAPNSRLVNDIIRMLLEKGEIAKAGDYLSKVDGKSISLQASTSSLMLSLFSRNGKYREDVKLLPAKYQFFHGLG